MPAPGFQLRRRLMPILICTAFVLSGCGGGAVSVRSNFSGPPIGSAPPARPAGPSAPSGLYAAGDGNVLLAVIVALMVIDGLNWATEQIRQVLADSDPAAAAEAPPAKPVERRTTRTRTYSWVFNQ